MRRALNIFIYRYFQIHFLVISGILILFLNINVLAKNNFKIKDKNGQITFGKNLSFWKYKKNFLGFSHIFLLKTKNDKHSNVSITFTGKKIELFDQALQKNIQEYKAGREEWANKRGLIIKSFEKYKSTKNQLGIEFHQVGFSYTTKFLGDVKEVSVFIVCKDKSLIHSKLLLFQEHIQKEKNIIDFLNSINKCQNSLRS